MKKQNYYNQAVSILQRLHTSYPQYNMGRHLATALGDYGDIWGVPDKELAYALAKYMDQLEMDFPHEDVKEIDRIIQQGMDLDNILKEEEPDGDY